MDGFDDPKTPNVCVTMLEDANNSLQELFNFSSQKQQVPLNQRNLPKSFFVPPTGSSDQCSTEDSPNFSTHSSCINGFIIAHSKANSSPACLDAKLTVKINSDHARQNSLGTPCDQKTLEELEIQMMINNSRMRPNLDVNLHQTIQPVGGGVSLNYAIGELPDGYEMAINDKKQVYFLNHQNQDTTWFDPRIPAKYQRWGMTISELEQLHINYARHLYGSNPEATLRLCEE
ncbi:unnamed protein product, partial [Protopolystoma xenopodis]